MGFPCISVSFFPSPFLPISASSVKTTEVSRFSLHVTCILFFPSCCPHPHSPFIFISEDLELGITDRENTQHLSFWVWIISIYFLVPSIYLKNYDFSFFFFFTVEQNFLMYINFALFLCQLKDIQVVPVF